jgi:hypothetical protein
VPQVVLAVSTNKEVDMETITIVGKFSGKVQYTLRKILHNHVQAYFNAYFRSIPITPNDRIALSNDEYHEIQDITLTEAVWEKMDYSPLTMDEKRYIKSMMATYYTCGTLD